MFPKHSLGANYEMQQKLQAADNECLLESATIGVWE